jgi:hypothetical protein
MPRPLRSEIYSPSEASSWAFKMRKKSQNQEKQNAYLLANMIAHVVIDAQCKTWEERISATVHEYHDEIE